MSRREAEEREDEWSGEGRGGEFWMIRAGDLDDGYYHLYSSTERELELWIPNKELRFDGEGFGIKRMREN